VGFPLTRRPEFVSSWFMAGRSFFQASPVLPRVMMDGCELLSSVAFAVGGTVGKVRGGRE